MERNPVPGLAVLFAVNLAPCGPSGSWGRACSLRAELCPLPWHSAWFLATTWHEWRLGQSSPGWVRLGGSAYCLSSLSGIQPPLPTLGRELTPSSPTHPPPLAGSLEILRENSSCLAQCFSSRPVPGGSPRKCPVPSRGGVRARSVPWDILRLAWGEVPFQKGNQSCLLAG